MLSFAHTASAEREFGKTLGTMGTQGTNSYFYVEGNFQLPCKFDVVYVPLTSTFGKFAYGQLLTAKALNVPLSRIDYIQNSSDICILTLVEL